MNIPYCFLPWNIIKKGAAAFYWLSDFINKSMPEVELELKKAEMNIRARNYVAAAIFSDVVLFVFLMILTSMIFLRIHLKSTHWIKLPIVTMIKEEKGNQDRLFLITTNRVNTSKSQIRSAVGA